MKRKVKREREREERKDKTELGSVREIGGKR